MGNREYYSILRHKITLPIPAPNQAAAKKNRIVELKDRRERVKGFDVCVEYHLDNCMLMDYSKRTCYSFCEGFESESSPYNMKDDTQAKDSNDVKMIFFLFTCKETERFCI